MVFQLLIYFTSLIESFSILGVEHHGLVQALEGVFVLFKLAKGEGHVEVDDSVIEDIQLIDLDALIELIDGRLILFFLEKPTGLLFELCCLFDVLQSPADLLIIRVNTGGLR